MVGELADTVFEYDTRVKRYTFVACSACQRVSDECSLLHTLYLVDHAKHNWRHVYAVGNHLHGHVGKGIDALHGAGNLKLMLLVDDRHGVVEVCGVLHASLVSCHHIFVCGACVTYRCHHTVVAARLYKLCRAGELGGFVPAFDARVLVEQRLIFFCDRRLYPLRNLCARLFGVEIGTLEVESKHRTVLFCHEFLTCLAGGLYHGHCRRRQCGEDRRGSVLHVRVYCHTECFLGAFHKIASTTAMYVQFYTARNDIASLCVDDFCVYNI